jgi:oxazoline/thiazoline synthase
MNRELWALDLTSDLGIPTFAVVSRRLDAREEIVQGYGAHFDSRIALLRALTECNQMLAHLNAAEDSSMSDPDIEAWYETATVAREPYLLPGAAERRRLTDFPTRASTDLREDVLTCVEIAAAVGLSTYVLDQTRPDIGLPVVKVIVPGLRHFWARFAPGRLYDVPVMLGRLDRPWLEEEMNPIPICS